MWEIGGTKFYEKDIDLLLSIHQRPSGISYVYLEPFMEIEKYYSVIKKFNDAVIELLKVAPTVNSVDDLQTEDDELEFIKAFRELIRIKNILTAFADFNWNDLAIEEQKFEDYKSKYLDLYDKVKSNHQKEKVSILEDVDFELELIHRDEINVAYIIQLLIKLKANVKKDVAQTEREIFNLLNTEVALRSKKELIEKFIQENLPVIVDTQDIPEEFEKFWNEEQQKAFEQLVKEENLSADRTQALIEDYLYAEREPLRDEVLGLIEGSEPKLLERRKIGDRILKKIVDFVDKFINGMVK